MLTGILIIWSIISSIFWLVIFLRALYVNHLVKNFSQIPRNTLIHWPRLSIIVTACNEANVIYDAVSSMLKIDYPDFEIILINDRSTDTTAKIIEQLAQEDKRIVPLHISHLPDEWLGKVHAYYHGSERAKGEWLLFTDADIFFNEADVIKKAISYCELNNIDNLSLMPKYVKSNSILLELTLLSMFFIALFIWNFIPDKNGKPKKTNSFGAFNLVRKSILGKSKGFKWIKMEAIDDSALSLLVYHAGGTSETIFATNSLSFSWYTSFKEFIIGLEKNSFAVFNYNYTILLFVTLLFLALFIGPFLVLLTPFHLLYFFPFIVYLFLVIIAYRVNLTIRQDMILILLVPFGFLLFFFTTWRAAILFWLKGGIKWRTTFYSSKALKKYQRVKIVGSVANY